jgi:Type IV secretion system pilin
MFINVLKTLAQISIPEDSLNIPKTEPSSDTVSNVLTLVFGILGALSFLVIVASGLRFSLSRGNAESVAKARNGIIYSAVGLAISMLAFAIVRFVAGRV